MGVLSKLPNIGKVLEDKLIEAGIDTPEKLIELGSKEAFMRIRAYDDTACINMLYGLEGAVQGIKDNYLSDQTKQDLKLFYKTLKG